MTARKMKLHFFSDPGHGWLRVKRPLLADLCIASQVSSYSHEKGDWVYLEEDCDATLLCEAMRSAGREFDTVRHDTYTTSKIRSYSSYRPSTQTPASSLSSKITITNHAPDMDAIHITVTGPDGGDVDICVERDIMGDTFVKVSEPGRPQSVRRLVLGHQDDCEDSEG